MTKYRLSADFVFEAENVADACRKLAAHFLKRALEDGDALSEDSALQGYITIAPDGENGDLN